MYKHILTNANEYLAKNQNLPDNTTVEGNGTALSVNSGIGGMIELAMIAEKECSIPSSGSIVLELLESDTLEGEYTESPITSSISSTEKKVWNKGDCIMRLPLSSYGKGYVKASISTTGSGVTGTVSIVPSYLPR